MPPPEDGPLLGGPLFGGLGGELLGGVGGELVPESAPLIVELQKPATQSLEQQSPKLTHFCPAPAQVAVGPPHLPWSQALLQQSLVTLHEAPFDPHVGAAQVPALQSPSQQSPPTLHCWPASLQLAALMGGTEQRPSHAPEQHWLYSVHSAPTR
jgi:hypothetical protein